MPLENLNDAAPVIIPSEYVPNSKAVDGLLSPIPILAWFGVVISLATNKVPLFP